MSPRLPQGPYADALEQIIASKSVDEILEAFRPVKAETLIDPSDGVKRSLALIWLQPETRPVIEWLFAMTKNAPYPRCSGVSVEELAVAAAKHEMRAVIGDLIGLAINGGLDLIETQRKVSHENAA